MRYEVVFKDLSETPVEEFFEIVNANSSQEARSKALRILTRQYGLDRKNIRIVSARRTDYPRYFKP